MTVSRIAGSLLIGILLSSSFVLSAEASSWPPGSHSVALTIEERIAGPDRYETAVAVARRTFRAWDGVTHVIVSSGENRAMADSLSAASLCWAYDAPLFLVSSSGVPPAVKRALEEMRSVNGTVTVTVVGGPVAVPRAVFDDLATIVGSDNVHQPWTEGSRYTTAAGVAELVSLVASETARAIPARAFVANGTRAAGYVDAATVSAVSVATGIPVLLVEQDRVPPATSAALDALQPGAVVVVGGEAAVSDAVQRAVQGDMRWAGSDRYATAGAVAAGAREQGWLTGQMAGFASALPDALTGATFIGRARGPLLLVRSDSVGLGTAEYLNANRGAITQGILFGSTAVLTQELLRELRGIPTSVRILAPQAGSRVAKRERLIVRTGINTTEVRVYVAGNLVATKPASSYSTVDFGLQPTPPEGSAYRIVARNVDGGEAAVTRTQPRYSYPAATSIVVDKSDFRLYFFKDDVFVKSYPVAIGRSSAETPVALWRIDSKYHTSQTSVYGPRKMRMYRQRGSSYVYTAYNIHGTNQPSSIGTKASAGCIRLFNADILDLFPRVPLGTIVQTRE